MVNIFQVGEPCKQTEGGKIFSIGAKKRRKKKEKNMRKYFVTVAWPNSLPMLIIPKVRKIK